MIQAFLGRLETKCSKPDLLSCFVLNALLACSDVGNAGSAHTSGRGHSSSPPAAAIASTASHITSSSNSCNCHIRQWTTCNSKSCCSSSSSRRCKAFDLAAGRAPGCACAVDAVEQFLRGPLGGRPGDAAAQQQCGVANDNRPRPAEASHGRNAGECNPSGYQMPHMWLDCAQSTHDLCCCCCCCW